MIENDLKFSKLNRFLGKKPEEYKEVVNILERNFASIKEIFEYYAAISCYPTIGMLDFSNFCNICHMFDKNLTRSDVDRLFIQTNFEVTDLPDNPDNSLCRYEFFEIIVRIACAKFEALPVTPGEKLKKLLNEHIFPYAQTSQAEYFRHDKLYTLEVNDVFEANYNQIQTLFVKYREKSGRWLAIDGLNRMLLKAQIEIPDKDLRQLFAYSKMSVLDEMENNDSFDRMVFVEFLECLARTSDFVYQDVTLNKKLEMLLDSIFPVNGLVRKEVEIEEEDFGASSDEEGNI